MPRKFRTIDRNRVDGRTSVSNKAISFPFCSPLSLSLSYFAAAGFTCETVRCLWAIAIAGLTCWSEPNTAPSSSNTCYEELTRARESGLSYSSTTVDRKKNTSTVSSVCIIIGWLDVVVNTNRGQESCRRHLHAFIREETWARYKYASKR